MTDLEDMRVRDVRVTFKGQPLTLLGGEVQVGHAAPDVDIQANDLSPARISDFRGNILVLSAVPSLDTSVCATETRRFNEEAVKLGENVKVLTISMDLPFAQKRWCAAEGIDRVKTFSDHLHAKFGEAYGVLIKELRLLARAIFVVDPKGFVRYTQLVHEVTDEPKYDEVIAAVRALQQNI